MEQVRRLGVLTAVAGAALALASLTFSGSAAATDQNWTDHEGNITTCPAGTQFDGQITSGSGSTELFDWQVTAATYVTISNIDPSVTGLTAYLKGGDGYRVYSPVIPGQQMRSPLNNGDQIPTLSHWMLCYGTTPSTTTLAPTTTIAAPTAPPTTVAVTTTTFAAPTVPPTVPEVTTTTVESGGPTTTTIASSGPTTTLVGDEGGLPGTGSGPSGLLGLGLAMVIGGVVVSSLARAPREN
jgi:hypothetical protein